MEVLMNRKQNRYTIALSVAMISTQFIGAALTRAEIYPGATEACIRAYGSTIHPSALKPAPVKTSWFEGWGTYLGSMVSSAKKYIQAIDVTEVLNGCKDAIKENPKSAAAMCAAAVVGGCMFAKWYYAPKRRTSDQQPEEQRQERTPECTGLNFVFSTPA